MWSDTMYPYHCVEFVIVEVTLPSVGEIFFVEGHHYKGRKRVQQLSPNVCNGTACYLLADKGTMIEMFCSNGLTRSG